MKWHIQRHIQDIELINEYFDSRSFEEELSSLPGKYAVPEGELLLAFYNEQPAGCMALRKIDTGSCEMERMFVYLAFHGKGIGWALTKAIIAEAGRSATHP